MFPSSSTSLAGCINTHRTSQNAEPCRIQGLAQPPPPARPQPPGPPAPTDRPAAATSRHPHSCHRRGFRVRRRAGRPASRVRSRPIAGRGAGAALRLRGRGGVAITAVISITTRIAMVSGDTGPGGSGGSAGPLRAEPLRAAGGTRPAPHGPWLRGPWGAAGDVLRGRSGSLVLSCWEAAAATPQPPRVGNRLGLKLRRHGGKAMVHLRERIRFRCHSLYS